MLKQRVLTALVIAPIAIACVFFLPITGFIVFVSLVLTISAWEWANLAGLDRAARFGYAAAIAILLAISTVAPVVPVLVIAVVWWLVAAVQVVFYPRFGQWWSSRVVRALLGVVALVPGLVALIALKQNVDGNFLILLLFFLIWGADIGAYFSGKAFGTTKLMPRVSPGKSWAGFYGGMLTAVLIALGMAVYIGKPDLISLRGGVYFAGCLLVAVVSVFGDLTESMFKRFRGIKDSSNLLPGHGGFLDRIDSLIAAGPVFALFILLFGWV